MSRYMNPPIDAVLGAIPRWQQRCLIDGLGLFVDEPVWTPAAFDDLKKHYIDEPDTGTGNFFSKLGTQLDGTSPAAQWLAVDIAWLMYLFPHGSIGAAKKVENLNQIASLGGQSLPPDHWALAPQVLQGVGGTGAFFVVSFWLEYSYAMLVLEAFVHLPNEQRAPLLQADADLMGWLDGLALPAELPAGVQLNPQTRMFRHIWLFLMQPDRFERIGSTSQKRAIVKRLAPKVGLVSDLSSPRRVDELLLQIRRTKEAELGTTELDFYQAPLHALWTESALPPATQLPAATVLTAAEPTPALTPAPLLPASGKRYWLVGSYIDDVDQTETFVAEGRWSGVFLDTFLDRVKAVKVGDRIAIKAAYTRKHGLPFDAQGKTVACMAIKARGVVTHNLGDGLNLTVDWESGFEPFVIYNCAYRWAISQVDAQRWPEVVRWVFDGEKQTFSDLSVIDDDDGDAGDEPGGEIITTVPEIAEPHNVIYYGPPGTGKTYKLMHEVLPAYTDELVEPRAGQSANEARHRYELVTFHPSYAYEDFVEGLRPMRVTQANGSSTVEIQPVAGALKRICARARLDPDRRYALVIDEINRGNVAKIFGELITLVEADKRLRFNERGQRVQGIEVRLPYTGEAFGVPANVDLYGTMNTSDRSIALVDIALRRRFVFKELSPNPQLIAGSDGEGQIDSDDAGEPIDMRRMLHVINSRMLLLRGRESVIGHAYFTAIKDVDALRQVFRERLIPLLQEHFYDDWAGVANVLAVKAGSPPFMLARTPKAAALFWGSNDAVDGMDDWKQWSISPTLPASAFRALYEDIPESAWLTLP